MFGGLALLAPGVDPDRSQRGWARGHRVPARVRPQTGDLEGVRRAQRRGRRAPRPFHHRQGGHHPALHREQPRVWPQRGRDVAYPAGASVRAGEPRRGVPRGLEAGRRDHEAGPGG